MVFSYNRVNEAARTAIEEEKKISSQKYSTGVVYTNIETLIEKKPYTCEIQTYFVVNENAKYHTGDHKDMFLEMHQVDKTVYGSFPLTINFMISASIAGVPFTIIRTDDIFEIYLHLQTYLDHLTNLRTKVISKTTNVAKHAKIQTRIDHVTRLSVSLKSSIKVIIQQNPEYAEKYPDFSINNIFQKYT